MTPRIGSALLCLSLSASGIGAQAPARIDSLALSRKWTEWLFDGQIDSLVAAQPPSERTAQTKESLTQTYNMLTTRGGTELSIVEEKFIKRNGNTQYWRASRYTAFLQEPLVLRWAVNKKWEIIGVGLGPLSSAPPADKP